MSISQAAKQEPCVPATLVFYRLLADATGVRLADAAAPLGTAERVRVACLSSGFSRVAVRHLTLFPF